MEVKKPQGVFQKYRHGIVTLCKALICLFAVGSFIFCVAAYYPESDFHFWGYVIFAILYFIVLFANSNMYRCFSVGVLRRRELVFSFCISSFLTNLIMYFVLSLLCKFMIYVIPLFVTFLAQCLVGCLLLLLANRIFYRLRPVREAVMVCSHAGTENSVIGKFGIVRERYRICCLLSEDEGFDAICQKIADYSAVIVGDIDIQLRAQLINHCFEHNQRMLVLPSVQDIILHSAHDTFVSDSLVYLCKNRTMTVEQMAVKRLMDIVLSFLGLVVTSPVLLVTALCIKLQDGGPVFFRQVRYTRNMNTFTLIKFRSMVVDAEKNGARFTVPGDDRITRVGRIIRRLRIDELPQLFNILRGEMSLVGPRAERIENVDYYCEMMPEFRYRMKVKAGLTGYAQIYGKYNTTYEDKLKLDLFYIENCSILQDLQLLFLTVRVLFLPESTEGFSVTSIGEMDESQNDSAHMDHSA